VAASRRLSHRISEGDGIAFIVHVTDAAAAVAAEQDGAKALAADEAIAGLREATTLPLLWVGAGTPVEADAVAVRPGEDGHHDGGELETVVDVRDEEELERALEELDPEVFLLAADPGSDEDALELLLALLHDVPAGKLAIAELHDASADDVAELERAGVDAVLVTSRDVAALVPAEPPEV
jgi:hypothetical protein